MIIYMINFQAVNMVRQGAGSFLALGDSAPDFDLNGLSDMAVWRAAIRLPQSVWQPVGPSRMPWNGSKLLRVENKKQ